MFRRDFLKAAGLFVMNLASYQDPRDPLGVTVHAKNRERELRTAMEERSMEALRLYEPLPFQQLYHTSTIKEVLVAKGNQCGGSIVGFVEDARAVLACDPYNKYPKENGILACLGYGEKHIGRVIYRYLFQPGAFKIIKDEKTKQWRTFRPWPGVTGGDEHRSEQAIDAPPLIPKRFIKPKTWSWVMRSERVFSRVELTTGWVIYALNSAGDPNQGQGWQADLYHIDEDTDQPGWYDEAIARLAIRKGKLRWTALPHARNDDIVRMIQRGEEQKDNPNPTTKVIRATIFDNPYYPEESRQANIKLWKSQGEDVYRKRALGELNIGSFLMYPTLNRAVHNAIKTDTPRSKLQELITDKGGVPPDHWTRYMIVDPGSNCAATFWAVPPPDFGDFKLCYDELYIMEATAEEFAKQAKFKVQNHCFHDFIIDAHGGKLREMGTGLHPLRQYEIHMERLGIVCEKRGSRFKLAITNTIKNEKAGEFARENRLREWLTTRQDGTPHVYFVMDKVPNTVMQLEKFRHKTVKVGDMKITLEEGNRRYGTDLVDTVEYAAADGLPYAKPASSGRKREWIDDIIDGRKRMRRDLTGSLSRGIFLGARGDS